MGADGGAFTTAEFETQSSAGNPQYLAVEQRCDEFVAQLLGLHERQVALTPADNVLPEGVRQLKELSTETLERVQADLNRSSEDQKQEKIVMAAPNPLTQVLYDPAIVAAELERRQVQKGPDAAVLTWVEGHLRSADSCQGMLPGPRSTSRGVPRRPVRPVVGGALDCFPWLRWQDFLARLARGRQCDFV